MVSSNVLKQVQAISGLCFATFLAMHFASHFTLLKNFETAVDTMGSVRIIYQQPVFEIMLIVTVVVHMATNSVLYVRRSKVEAAVARSKKDSGATGSTTTNNVEGAAELNAHRIAGYILSLSLFGHVFAVRLAPLLALDDPSVYDYSFVTAAHERIPFNVVPIYLIIFGMAAVWHSIYGVTSALHTLTGGALLGRPFPTVLKPVALLGHVLIFNVVLALTGFYYHIDTKSNEHRHEMVMAKMGL